MRVTVSIVTRDRPAFLEAALSSVAGQSRKADEIIVVDDGAGSDAEDVCRRFGGVTYVRGAGQRGLAVARNIAVRQASGEIIVVQDDDDVMLPHRINDHLAAFADDVDVTGGGWANVAVRATHAAVRFAPGHATPTLETLLLGSAAMAHGAAAYRTTVLRAHAYDESLLAGADMHLHARLFVAGARYRHTGTYTLARRLHGESVTHQLSAAQRTVKDALRAAHMPDRNETRIDAPLARLPVAMNELGWALSLFGLDAPRLLVGASIKTLSQAVAVVGGKAPVALGTGGFAEALVPVSADQLGTIDTAAALVPKRQPDAGPPAPLIADPAVALGLAEGGGRVLLDVDDLAMPTLVALHEGLAPVSPAWRFAAGHPAFAEAFAVPPQLVLVSNRYTSGPALERAFKAIADVVQGLGLPVKRLGVAMARGDLVVGLRV